MVASEATSLACRSLQLDSIVTISRETHKNGQQAKLLQRSETTVGWISRNNLHSGRNGAFFLDIPFYRTHCRFHGERASLPRRLVDIRAGGCRKIPSTCMTPQPVA